VARETAEEVGPEHRCDQRAEASARLPRHAAVFGRGERAIAVVDERHDLVAEVRVVAPGPGRVDELAAAVRRPGVDVDNEARGRVAAREERVRLLGEGPAERRAVPPHRDVARVALEDVDGWVAPGRFLVVLRRHVDVQRPLVRVAERVFQ
jgi:hypothetical protein